MRLDPLIPVTQNAYDPHVRLDGWGWEALGVTAGLLTDAAAVGLGILVPPLGLVMLGGAIGYEAYTHSGEGWSGFGAAIGDLSGYNGLKRSINDPNLHDYDRGALFGASVGQLALTAYSAYSAADSPVGRALGQYALERFSPANYGELGSTLYSGFGTGNYRGPTLRGLLSVAKVAKADMIAEDLAELDPHDLAFYNAPHANSLESVAPAQGYILEDAITGEPLKYGMTTLGNARYSATELRAMGTQLNFIAEGSVAEMRAWETKQILDYLASTGRRPPLNLSNH